VRRRALFVAGLVVVALVAASGVALAASISCPNRAGNLCVGTDQADTMTGRNSSDDIRGRGDGDQLNARGGRDRLAGGPGEDQLFGGDANDRLLGDSGIDVLDGGIGNDVLAAGGGDDRYRYVQEGWGRDTITDTPVSDPNPGIDNELFIGDLDFTQSLSINLVS
jgi:Ca2+-binding RTX toxin-like protein